MDWTILETHAFLIQSYRLYSTIHVLFPIFCSNSRKKSHRFFHRPVTFKTCLSTTQIHRISRLKSNTTRTMIQSSPTMKTTRPSLKIQAVARFRIPTTRTERTRTKATKTLLARKRQIQKQAIAQYGSKVYVWYWKNHLELLPSNYVTCWRPWLRRDQLWIQAVFLAYFVKSKLRRILMSFICFSIRSCLFVKGKTEGNSDCMDYMSVCLLTVTICLGPLVEPWDWYI